MTLFCIIVIPIFIGYVNEGDKSRVLNNIKNYTDSNTEDYIDLQIDLVTADPVNKKVDLFVQLDPIGGYSFKNKTSRYDIDINFRFIRKSILKGEFIEPFQLSLPFAEGSLRDYPFELFLVYFPIEIIIRSSSLSSNEIDLLAANTNINFYGTSQLFRVRYEEVSNQDKSNAFYSSVTILPNSKLIMVKLLRPPTTLLVCTFMVVLMWCLAIAMINIAIDAVFNNREIPPPILGTSVAMLFALPALRNSQPGVPAMGCISDILGFFWSLVLISIAAVTLLFK
ncbi:hypothetical protein K502DRAFT_325692 [Neoconidiobolus thromboides FSU 785]|nr:hypothetical protein K502DRAFT_325692 [Neoconidiobolus thromboides FSU 785]